jgi:3-oxoacyl-[acyl-carrier protein] reductase
MGVDDFMAPVETAARTTFLTARAAARHMIRQRSGVILAFGGPGDRSGPLRDYYLGSTQVAFDAIETIRRQLAVELGSHGIRVVRSRAEVCRSRFPRASMAGKRSSRVSRGRRC